MASHTDDLSPQIAAAAAAVREALFFVVASDLQGEEDGTGTATAVDRHHALTNAHFIPGETGPVTLVAPDGRSGQAVVAGRDELLDLVLLRLSEPMEDVSEPVKLSARRPDVGQSALTVGRSLQGPMTSFGIVNNPDESLYLDADEVLDGLIHTDASLAPEMSGGPLVSLKGTVLGLTSARLTTSDGSSYALPAGRVAEAADALRRHGRVRHPWIGIMGRTETIDRRWVDLFELPAAAGVLIVDMFPEGPAADAGLAAEDLVIGLADRPVRSVEQLRRAISSCSVGQVVQVEIMRGAHHLEVPVRIAEYVSTA